jgi:hypothetical protein
VSNDSWCTSSQPEFRRVWEDWLICQQQRGDIDKLTLLLGQVTALYFPSVRLEVDEKHSCEEVEEKHRSYEHEQDVKDIGWIAIIERNGTEFLDLGVPANLHNLAPAIQRWYYKQSWDCLRDVIEIVFIVNPSAVLGQAWRPVHVKVHFIVAETKLLLIECDSKDTEHQPDHHDHK